MPKLADGSPWVTAGNGTDDADALDPATDNRKLLALIIACEDPIALTDQIKAEHEVVIACAPAGNDGDLLSIRELWAEIELAAMQGGGPLH